MQCSESTNAGMPCKREARYYWVNIHGDRMPICGTHKRWFVRHHQFETVFAFAQTGGNTND